MVSFILPFKLTYVVRLILKRATFHRVERISARCASPQVSIAGMELASVLGA